MCYAYRIVYKCKSVVVSFNSAMKPFLEVLGYQTGELVGSALPRSTSLTSVNSKATKGEMPQNDTSRRKVQIFRNLQCMLYVH